MPRIEPLPREELAEFEPFFQLVEQGMGFVPASDFAGASSIVESPAERTFLAAGDPVFVGMGEGDVVVGDQFTVFQVEEQVRDVETNRLLGYHVEKLGWISTSRHNSSK